MIGYRRPAQSVRRPCAFLSSSSRPNLNNTKYKQLLSHSLSSVGLALVADIAGEQGDDGVEGFGRDRNADHCARKQLGNPTAQGLSASFSCSRKNASTAALNSL